MEPTEAIGILRGTTSPASVLHPQIAADMGANALAAWDWVKRNGADVTKQSGKWHCAVGWFTHTIQDSPLAAVLDAMAKEAVVEAAPEPEVKP